jgi:hypothetical protein
VGAAIALALLTPWVQWWPFMHWPWLGPTLDGQREVARALARDRPRTVGLVSCFWSLAHFPFRPDGATAWKHHPSEDGLSSLELRRLRSQLREMDAIVYCPRATETARRAAYASDCVLFENQHYLVQKGPVRCGSADRRGKKSTSHRRPGARTDAPATAGAPEAGSKASGELGAAELKLDPCASVGESGAVRVPGCRGPFIVFGPYWSLPAGTDVEVSFEVHAESELSLFAEVVSDAGRLRHGALLSEAVSVGDVQTFNYRVRLQQATKSLETRIVLDGDQPATFELRRLRVRSWLPAAPVKAPAEPSARSR